MRELVVWVAKDRKFLLRAGLREGERQHGFGAFTTLTFEELGVHAGSPSEPSHEQATGRSEN